jgi:hypothetical protein
MRVTQQYSSIPDTVQRIWDILNDYDLPTSEWTPDATAQLKADIAAVVTDLHRRNADLAELMTIANATIETQARLISIQKDTIRIMREGRDNEGGAA